MIHSRIRAAAVSVLIAGALVGGLSAPTNAAPGRGGGDAVASDDLVLPPGVLPSAPAVPQGARQFPTADDAVAAQVVDQAVLDELRATGRVEAMLVVDADDIDRDARRNSGSNKGKRLEQQRTGYGDRKGKARGGDRVKVLTDHENLPTQLVEITSEDDLLRLANAAEVGGVRANAVMEATAAQSDAASLSLIRQPTAAAGGSVGRGTYVAVLDTGVDYRQPAFGSCTAPGVPATTCRVAASLLDDDGFLDDGSLHGTNVAGVVANVAPGAQVVVYDVFSWQTDPADGKVKHLTDSNRLASAINDVIAKKAAGWNITAMNLSIGSAYSYNTVACTASWYEPMLKRVWDAKVIPVVAAGNDRYTKATTTSPSVARVGVSNPGCSTYALTVGAVYDTGLQSTACPSPVADAVTCFSQTHGALLDVLAPGAFVEAAGIGMNGTSQATPHVAGALAVLAGARPTATPSQLWTAITGSGPKVWDALAGTSFGRLDLPGALAALGGAAVDTTAPTVSAVSHTPQASGTANAGSVPYVFSWTASDASGISTSAAYLSVNGGAWQTLTLPSAAARSFSLNLAPGTRYRVAVQARDGAGNWSAHAYSATFGVYNMTEATTAAAYTTGWASTAWTSALDGGLRTTGTLNASVTFTFTGTSVAWVASKATNRGKATVYFDGVLWGTWDLYSASTQARAIVLNWSSLSSGTHTLRIVNQATAGRPTIDVDSFIVTA